MAKSKNKIVDYIDPQTQRKQRVILPEETPSEFANEGVPVSIDLSGLYPEPFSYQLEQALWQRGIITPDDLQIPGALTLIRQALQHVLKMDANDIYQHVLRSNNHDHS